MDTSTFLQGVLGTEGHYCVWALKEQRMVQKFYGTIDELEHAANNLNENGFDTYYALATFDEAGSREADNVRQLRAFFMDLDCGVHLKRGTPKDFPDQSTAIAQLRAFCKTANLPRPTMVNSGYGVHVYWPLTEPVSLVEWLPVAERLKALANFHGFKADKNVTADAARVLRVPGTSNHKGDTPAPVTVLGISDHAPVSFETFAARVNAADLPTKPVSTNKFTPRPAHSAMMDALIGKREARFKTILEKTAEGKGCAQLAYIIQEQATMEEPMWRAGLSIAAFCSDGAKAARIMSEGYPEYDSEEMQYKLSRIKGPYLCTRFDEYNPGVCVSCPHWNKIKSPIVLGHQYREATEEENTVVVPSAEPDKPAQVYQIPPYPKPYFRGAGGGVFLRQTDEDGEVIERCIHVHDLYVVKRIIDPEIGDSMLFRLHLPRDGVREFVIPNHVGTSKDKFREAISSAGIYALGNEVDALMRYTQAWVNELQHTTTAELAHRQFGWIDDKLSGFVLGSKVLYADRSEYNAPAANTRATIGAFSSKGTLDDWKRTIAFYDRPGFELHQFVVCAGFGSALIQFTPVHGSLIHLWSKDSGFGKTHALYSAMSIWGNPEQLMLKHDDTYVSKMNRAEVYRSVPVCMDEITNIKPTDASELIYQATSGQQRNRMSSGSNNERYRGDPWKLLFITTGNTSLIDKVSLAKAMPRAEAQRVIEMEATRLFHGAVDKELTDKFSLDILNNYGTAGEVFIQFVLNNVEAVRELVRQCQKNIDVRAQLSSDNRFWSAVCAATIAAASICKQLGLLTYDVKNLTDYTINTIIRTNQAAAGALKLSAADLVTQYVYENWGKVLQIKSTIDRRGKNNNGIDELVVPDHQPRVDIVGRYETDLKQLYLVIKPFRVWLAEQQINFASVYEELRTTLQANKLKMRITKGTHMNLPATDVVMAKIALEDPTDAGAST